MFLTFQTPPTRTNGSEHFPKRSKHTKGIRMRSDHFGTRPNIHMKHFRQSLTGFWICVCALLCSLLRADYGNKTIMGFGTWRENPVRGWELSCFTGIYQSGLCVCTGKLAAFTSSLHHFPPASLTVFSVLISSIWPHDFLSFSPLVRTSHSSISSHHAASFSFISLPLSSLNILCLRLPGPNRFSPSPNTLVWTAQD